MQTISPKIIDDNNFNQIISNNSFVIVDFWADWCGPCKAMTPIIEELSSIYENQVLLKLKNLVGKITSQILLNPYKPSQESFHSVKHLH